jgi:hypothetical protein
VTTPVMHLCKKMCTISASQKSPSVLVRRMMRQQPLHRHLAPSLSLLVRLSCVPGSSTFTQSTIRLPFPVWTRSWSSIEVEMLSCGTICTRSILQIKAVRMYTLDTLLVLGPFANMYNGWQRWTRPSN